MHTQKHSWKCANGKMTWSFQIWAMGIFFLMIQRLGMKQTKNHIERDGLHDFRLCIYPWFVMLSLGD